MYFKIFHEIPNFEQRTLAPRPILSEITLPGISTYMIRYTDFLKDNFGFRNELIRLNSLISFHLFKTSPVQQVVIGEKGWLYYNSGTDGVNLPDYYGQARFNSHELESMKIYFSKVKNTFTNYGIYFLVVLAPNKQTIYPEFLPANIRNMRGRITRADQMAQIFRDLNIEFLDLRSPLLDAKKDFSFELYHKLGTHWNQLGGFIAYQKIMENIQKKYPAVRKLSIGEFQILNEKNSTDAGCAVFAGIRGTIPENNIELHPISALNNHLSAEDYKQKYIECKGNDINAPKILFFRDSYLSAMVRYLAESFSQSIFIWQRKIDFGYIEKEKPDIVILQFAERYSGYVYF
jgi:hypothetical protein